MFSYSRMTHNQNNTFAGLILHLLTRLTDFLFEAHGFDHYLGPRPLHTSAEEKNVFLFFHSFSQRKATMEKQCFSGPVHMILGQLIAPGQLTDPGVIFASVHGLMSVTVHMSFSLPRGNFERRVTRCTTPGNPPCRGNFSPCEQNAEVAPGQE